jgi:hypothetical protein
MTSAVTGNGSRPRTSPTPVRDVDSCGPSPLPAGTTFSPSIDRRAELNLASKQRRARDGLFDRKSGDVASQPAKRGFPTLRRELRSAPPRVEPVAG